MMKKLKKVWVLTKNNWKIAVSVISTLFLLIFAFSWYRKNTKIRKLQQDLILSRAKVRIAKVVDKYNITVEQLDGLREKDAVVEKEISKIERDLTEKLKPDMTPEEIVAKFKEIGITPKLEQL